QVQPHLTQTLITTFQQKQVELSTLKRVYCSSPTCSLFLGPVSEGIFGGKVYTCPAPGCGRRTCGKCREQHDSNRSHACRPNADAAQVLELSRTAGWARCPGCSQMIELNMGCFHMTCRCRTEFCYVCQARWKTCRCPQWDERRLMVAAEERVDAQLGVRRDAPVRRAVPVAVPAPANRVPAVQVRPPPPVPARRPAPAPPRPYPITPVAPNRFVAPAQPVAPVQPPLVGILRTPARTPTASNTAARPASTASTTNARASGSGSPTVPQQDPMRQRLVREMMERLRVDHDCDHTQWHYRKGGGICQTCGHHLPIYLLRCQGCEILACKRCRHNRL
ncbi:hypothetical protein HD554DRAFT_2029818, partial [Boletus coccyginus]